MEGYSRNILIHHILFLLLILNLKLIFSCFCKTYWCVHVYWFIKDDHYDIGPDDLLSWFPDSILVSILSYLPPKDAAVTSKISKRWRYLWCQIGRLNFKNEEILYNIAKNPKTCLKERNNFINWVNRVIRQHKSKKIDDFKISFNLGKESKCIIGKWIEFAIRKMFTL